MQNYEVQNQEEETLSLDEAERAGAFSEDALSLTDAEESVGDVAMSADDTLATIAQLREAKG